MIKKITFLLFFILFIPQSFAASNIEINLQANKEQVAVNEQVQITVSVKQISSQMSINMQNVPIRGIESFNQIGSSNSTQIRMMNGITAYVSENIKTLIAMKDGVFNIGPVQLTISDQNGNTETIQSNTIIIKVIPPQSLSNNTLTDDNTDYMLSGKIKYKIRKIITWIFGILLIGFSIGIYYYSKKSDKKLNLQKINEIDTEYKIKTDLVLVNTNDENFYIKIKENFLKYLKSKYNIETETLTTKEILTQLRQKNIYKYKEIKKILETIDNSRFAKTNDNKEIIIEELKKII